MSLSLHAASSPQAFLFSAIMQTICGILLLVFMYVWFIPTLHLSVMYTVSFAVTSICLVLAAWIADVPGRKHLAHNTLIYIMGVLLILMNGYLIVFVGLSVLVKTVLVLTTSCMVVTVLLFSFVKWSKNNFLFLQLVFLVSYHLSILAATYLH